jgi:hypothetical protein
MDSEDPMFDMPSTAIEEPMRVMDLRDNEDPRWTKSRTESEDPIRAIPNTANVEARRAHDLNAREEPR